MLKSITTLILSILASGVFAAGGPSTYFNIFVPPNNDAVRRDVCLIVTAIYDNTTFEIIDDNMDGDSDDNASGTLMAGQSYILYIRDNGINDDAKYASGGELKWDGDYFEIKSDKLVYASQSTDSDWQHDWVPAVNRKSTGQKFIVYAPKNTNSNRDLNVFVYNDETTVTIKKISTTPKTNTGFTNVDATQAEEVGKITLNIGEDIIYKNRLGRNILETGATYVIESTGDMSLMYGALYGNEKDGGGYVPSSNGSSSGELFYFGVPQQGGNKEQEIRIVSWDVANSVSLERYDNGNWVSMKDWNLNEMETAEWVGRTENQVHKTVFRARCSAGKKVSIFAANWLETGNPGTSDIATMVSAEDGSASGDRFLVYMAPPGRENNVVDPFTGQKFGAEFTHVFLFAKNAATVTVRDANTNGAEFNRTFNIAAGRYADCALSLSEWRSIYNGDGNANSGDERPYLLVTSDEPIAVMNTNFNDNWMMYFGSSLEESFDTETGASRTEGAPGDTVTFTCDVVFNTTSTVFNTIVEAELGDGATITSGKFVANGDEIDATISRNESNSIASFEGTPNFSPTGDYSIEVVAVLSSSYNDGEQIDGETVLNAEFKVSGEVDGNIQQSVQTRGVVIDVEDASNLLFEEISNVVTQESDNSWTSSWVDLDNDGFDDLVVTNNDDGDKQRIYRNNNLGGFFRRTIGDLYRNDEDIVATSWADYDNDGDMDGVAAANGGHPYLYKNNGGFDLGSINGGDLTASPTYAHGISYADYNRDGIVDVFIADFMPTNFNRLYKGNANGKFSLVENSVLSQAIGYCIGASWADYDNDGYPDLFVPFGQNENNALYHNNGDGTFTAVTDQSIVTDGGNSVGSTWGDYNGDCLLDLFVANASGQANFLYTNNGDGTFDRVLTGVIATDRAHSHGCNWVDFDNDGDLDLYVADGSSETKSLYQNDGTGNFSRNNAEIITAALGETYGTSWADYDRNGFMDLFISTHTDNTNKLYRNKGNGNNWFELRLKGTRSNGSAVGAKIKLKSNGKWQCREVNSQSGFGGQNSIVAHFGLGAASTVDSIEIQWPSGYKQYITNYDANNYVRIEEDDLQPVLVKVYQDANANCTADETSFLANQRVKVTPGDIYYHTNENGEFTAYLASGDYKFDFVETTNWKTFCGTVEVNVGMDVATQYIGVEALTNDPDPSINFSTAAQRKGFRNACLLNYSNKGTAATGPMTIEVRMTEGLFFVASEVPCSSHTNGVYYWEVASLEAGESISINLFDSVSTDFTVGDELVITATIIADVDVDLSNNISEQRTVVTGPIDPNDILVSPRGDGVAGYINGTETLTYRIRFQNVGTALAERVFVTNELPTELDLTTLELVATSHEAQMRVEGNMISWEFRGIRLPDSVSNEAGSHGFIEYRIKPLSGLREGTSIYNDAAIVFDFEDAVETNTTRNTIKFDGGDVQGALLISPNPMVDYTIIQPERNMDRFDNPSNITEITVMDGAGKVIRSITPEEATSYRLDRTNLISGNYYIHVMDAAGNSYGGKLFVK